ncbi:hypothetical protein H9Q13_08600 [Pontibacter sp. JH31]|uniref:Lipoprotein n=1 Tax=Pontibacter aquaedesilientis TaxID=2766980 RepID=A0ABR7XG12_9BACT|nr:hypothetical protein [Pontibacter aquaedesilientis]MBD1397221.1 hypothetical protein [Pontibacter aquaedesilientis]
MKKLLPLLLGITLTLMGCDKDDCNPARNSSSFESNKSIAVHYNGDAQQDYYHVVNGENLVFSYSHVAPECENTMDDEWGYTLTFEVGKDATTFRFEGAELPIAKGFYQEWGAWVSSNTHPLDGGLIEGTKMADGKWRVKADVTAQASTGSAKRITFDTVFQK